MPALPPDVAETIERISPDLAAAIEAADPPPIGEGTRVTEIAVVLRPIVERLPPKALAALWLAANELDRSHRISQSIDDPDGSYLHGVMHRREGDFDNAKYWFRRASNHPVEAALADAHPNDYRDAISFVDACQRGDEAAESIAWTEWCEMARRFVSPQR